MTSGVRAPPAPMKVSFIDGLPVVAGLGPAAHKGLDCKGGCNLLTASPFAQSDGETRFLAKPPQGKAEWAKKTGSDPAQAVTGAAAAPAVAPPISFSITWRSQALNAGYQMTPGMTNS